jgi:cytochrome c553
MIRNIATALVAALALTGVARAEGVAKPEAVSVCAACHGENGVSKAPIYPNLAGQQRSYIEHSLLAYKDGKRKNPIMGAQAANLSDADIKALSLWFSSQTPVLYTPSPEGEDVKAAAKPAAAAEKKG